MTSLSGLQENIELASCVEIWSFKNIEKSEYIYVHQEMTYSKGIVRSLRKKGSVKSREGVVEMERGWREQSIFSLAVFPEELNKKYVLLGQWL